MDLAEFERVRDRLVATAAPSGGDDLLGMSMDFDAYLYRVDDLHDIRVGKTGDPRRLIAVTARSGSRPADVAIRLEQVWLDHLRYQHSEAHAVVVQETGVEFVALTQIDPGGFYVTASITVACREPGWLQ